jgi:hypothetical protein
MNIFSILMLLSVAIQMGCFIYIIVTETDPLDILWGYSIWGMIPVIGFAILSMIN